MSPLSVRELLGLPVVKPEAPRLVPNRADRRRWLQPAKNPRRSAAGRRVARPRCQHGTPLPFPWSVPTVYCQVCAAEATALLAKQAAVAAELAEETAPRRRRIRAADTQAGER